MREELMIKVNTVVLLDFCSIKAFRYKKEIFIIKFLGVRQKLGRLDNKKYYRIWKVFIEEFRIDNTSVEIKASY
jgi:hypothetical protein